MAWDLPVAPSACRVLLWVPITQEEELSSCPPRSHLSSDWTKSKQALPRCFKEPERNLSTVSLLPITLVNFGCRRLSFALRPWFSTFLMLPNAVPHAAVVSPNHKIISLLLCSYNCVTVVNHNINICLLRWSWVAPCERVIQPPNGSWPTG